MGSGRQLLQNLQQFKLKHFQTSTEVEKHFIAAE
jgi:hypothetical protein